jgi:hypothetical protein
MDRADAQTYSPPKAVQEAAQRAVRWIDEGPLREGQHAHILYADFMHDPTLVEVDNVFDKVADIYVLLDPFKYNLLYLQ